MFRKKKKLPFTVKVCYVDGKIERFENVIDWEDYADNQTELEFNDGSTTYIYHHQIRWASATRR